jgi:predicted nucleic acid-binding protein
VEAIDAIRGNERNSQLVAAQPAAALIEKVLSAASQLVASDLTFLESDRVFTAVVAARRISTQMAAERRAKLYSATTSWLVLPINSEVADRVRQPFPEEPVRTLDAIHLATALVARARVPDLEVLSLDARVRANAALLGFKVQPVQT